MLRHATYKRNEKDFATNVVEDDATGLVTLYVDDKAAVTSETDPVTGGIGLIGPNGAKIRRVVKNTAVYIGDSIVQNGSNPTHGQRNSRSVLQHALRKLGRPIRVVAEVGYSGARTDEIFAHYDVVTANDPGFVFWSSGTNDFSAGASPDTLLERLIAVKNKVVSDGRRFVYLGMPPVAFSGAYHRFLQLLKSWCEIDPDFIYISASHSLLDYSATPEELAGLKKKSGLVAADGVHPMATGAVAWGELLAKKMMAMSIFRQPELSPTSATSGSGDYVSSFIANGLVGASGTGFSSAVTPTASRVMVNSTVDMGDSGIQDGLPGRLFRTVFSPGESPALNNLMRALNNSDITAGAERYAGKKYVMRAYAKASAVGGNIRGLYLGAECYSWDYLSVWGGRDGDIFDPNDATGTWLLNVSEYEGIFETTPFSFPPTWAWPGKLHASARFFMTADPGATVTLDIGAIEIREVD